LAWQTKKQLKRKEQEAMNKLVTSILASDYEMTRKYAIKGRERGVFKGQEILTIAVNTWVEDGGSVAKRALGIEDINSEKVIKELLRAKSDVNTPDYTGGEDTPLHTAAWYGELGMVKLLIKAKADTAKTNLEDETSMMKATRALETKKEKLYQTLPKKIKKVMQEVDERVMTEIHEHRLEDQIRIQVSSRISSHPNLTDEVVEKVQEEVRQYYTTWPPRKRDLPSLAPNLKQRLEREGESEKNELVTALREKHVEEINILDTGYGHVIDLIAQEAERQVKTSTSGVHKRKNAGPGDNDDLALLNYEKRLTHFRKDLFLAAKNNRIEEIRSLIEKGAPVDCEDGDGWTPLMITSLIDNSSAEKRGDEGHYDLLEYEEESKKRLDAIYEQRVETAQCLLDYHANPSHVTNDGDTPLHSAVRAHNIQLVKVLLTVRPNGAGRTWKADTLAKNVHGDTALHLAAAKGDDTLVMMLVRNGSDCDARNRSGRSPRALAEHCKHVQIAVYLRTNRYLRGYQDWLSTRPRRKIKAAAKTIQLNWKMKKDLAVFTKLGYDGNKTFLKANTHETIVARGVLAFQSALWEVRKEDILEELKADQELESNARSCRPQRGCSFWGNFFSWTTIVSAPEADEHGVDRHDKESDEEESEFEETYGTDHTTLDTSDSELDTPSTTPKHGRSMAQE